MGGDRGCDIHRGDGMKGCCRHLTVCHNSCRVGVQPLLLPRRYYNYIAKMGDTQSRYYHVSWVCEGVFCIRYYV